MTREEAYKYFEIEFDGEYDWMPDMTELQFKTFIDKVYDSFEATIEAQEIIIKDKSAIMEAMAQPKTCDDCKWKHSGLNSKCLGCARYWGDNYELKAQP